MHRWHCLTFRIHGHSSAGRAAVSKTVGRGFESYCPCKELRVMDKIRFYIRESYEELIHKVSWPTWRDLIENTRIVIIATIIFALIIFLMDVVSNSAMNFIYGLN